MKKTNSGSAPANLTLHINEQCNFGCAHCVMGFSAADHGKKSRLTPAGLRAVIRQSGGNQGRVMLAGGEPTLSPELAAACIDECAKAGLESCLVSAPYWAGTAASAGKMLDTFPGLDNLTLSYDRYHLERLSLAHYRNAARAAFERGIEVTIHLIYISRADLASRLRELAPLKRYLAEIYGMPVVSVGNAASLDEPTRELVTVRSARDLARFPRFCVAGAPLLDYRGDLHGCCFDGAVGSSFFSLPPRRGEGFRARLARLAKLPLLRTLSKYGFLGSLSAEGREYLADKVKGRAFASECDICLAMMKEQDARLLAYAAAGPGPGVKPQPALSWVLWKSPA